MRSAVAKQHGLDEALVAQLNVRDPDLTDAQRAAIDFARALMVAPGDIPADLRSSLRHHFTHDQIIEIALDVMKWSYQKVPVALGVDREVTPGELTDLAFDQDGHWIRPD
ncbi:MAG: hypothetical protein WA964_06905 [Ilumatobacter sp.]|uniref:carboxymuconolactone decarboxylase family protein n=1 Tax=Ilumatobacter sp. TaxID=1967498 RepID=UPI003C73CB81